MIALLKNILHLAWTLWFGGMVVLLIFVTQLFKKSHATGVDAAPVLFNTFAAYQLIVGGIACSAAAALAAITRRRTAGLLTLVMLIAFAAAILLHGWTHEIDRLQALGQNQTPRFKHLHALTGIAYITAASALLISGTGWRNLHLQPRTISRTESATSFPGAMPHQSAMPPESPVQSRPG